MHGPACIFGANLTPFALETHYPYVNTTEWVDAAPSAARVDEGLLPSGTIIILHIGILHIKRMCTAWLHKFPRIGAGVAAPGVGGLDAGAGLGGGGGHA
jgi:hypothetical protein